MEIWVTFGELLDKGTWDEFCSDRGINTWCINEGLASRNEQVLLSLEEANKYDLFQDHREAP